MADSFGFPTLVLVLVLVLVRAAWCPPLPPRIVVCRPPLGPAIFRGGTTAPRGVSQPDRASA